MSTDTTSHVAKTYGVHPALVDFLEVTLDYDEWTNIDEFECGYTKPQVKDWNNDEWHFVSLIVRNTLTGDTARIHGLSFIKRYATWSRGKTWQDDWDQNTLPLADALDLVNDAANRRYLRDYIKDTILNNDDVCSAAATEEALAAEVEAALDKHRNFESRLTLA